MFKKVIIILLFFVALPIFATDHGIYLLTVSDIQGNIDDIGELLKQKIESEGFEVYSYLDVATPNMVLEDSTEQCSFKAKLLVFSSEDYIEMLTSYGNKYLVASLLRIGLYETPEGIQVTLADPETINRIIFNDFWEEELEENYNEVVTKTQEYKSKLVKLTHSLDVGDKVELPMEPIRDDEDLRESSRDMFMMVGQLTFFNDEDQFPEIYTRKNEDGVAGLDKIRNEFLENMKKFTPLEDDVEYRLTSSPEVLNWKTVAEVSSPDKKAVLLGITRSRTEGLSFHIAGRSRETDTNYCPGIDHVAAYPIEVLILQKDDNIVVYTPREMFRMDMYFWDAGMAAFMDHMSMPGILDESIKKALLGDEYVED